jgi:molybdenum cofactor cytidylyltransferase
MAEPFRCGLVLLAAGASTRMGRPKQLLEIDGVPLVRRAAEAALAAPVWPVIVVLGAHAEKIRPTLASLPLLLADNAEWAEGLASSLRAGIRTLGLFSAHLDAAVIALCDQPGFSTETVAQLLALRRTSGRSIVATLAGGHLGPPVLFDREFFPALQMLEGDAGARQLLLAQREKIAVLEAPALATDLDTPADYEKFLAERQSQSG